MTNKTEYNCDFFSLANTYRSCSLYELSDYDGEPIYEQIREPYCQDNQNCYYKQLTQLKEEIARKDEALENIVEVFNKFEEDDLFDAGIDNKNLLTIGRIAKQALEGNDAG